MTASTQNLIPTSGSRPANFRLSGVKWFEPYLLVPFKDMGRDDRGWDCWGAVRFILKERAGIDLPSYIGNDRDEIAAQAALETDWIKVENPRPLDVATLLVPTRAGAFPFHVGVIVEPHLVLHAAKNIGTVCVGIRTLNIHNIYRHRSCR